jgi:hypothetical protein
MHRRFQFDTRENTASTKTACLAPRSKSLVS